MRYLVNVNGKQFDVQIDRVGAAVPSAGVEITQVAPTLPTPAPAVGIPSLAELNGAIHEVLSPMPGTVLDVMVEVGQQVNEGEVVLMLEAMKMEIEVNATATGTVKQILTNIGSSVGAEDVLIVIS